MDNLHFDMPSIAEGRVIPHGVQKVIDDHERLEEEKREAEKRAQTAMDNERRSQNIATLSLIVTICSLVVALATLAITAFR